MGLVWDIGIPEATRLSDACILCVGACITGECMAGSRSGDGWYKGEDSNVAYPEL